MGIRHQECKGPVVWYPVDRRVMRAGQQSGDTVCAAGNRALSSQLPGTSSNKSSRGPITWDELSLSELSEECRSWTLSS